MEKKKEKAPGSEDEEEEVVIEAPRLKINEAALTGEAIANALSDLQGLDREAVRKQRREKFLAMGRNGS